MSGLRGAGLVLRDSLAWEDLREIAGAAEDTGYAALFVPEIAGREAFSTLTGLATVTERVALGSGVVPMDARRPEVTAMAAATLHDASGGRHVLGVGAGHPPPGTRPGPLERLREYVRVIRGAVGGERVFSTMYGIDAFELDLRLDDPPSIWLAALGDRMVGLAGRIADGVLLNWCTPDRVSAAAASIRRTAADAGRDPDEVSIAVYVRACIGPPAPVALRALQDMTGRYASAPNYLAQFEAMGFGDAAHRAAKAFADARAEDVPETLVDALCVRGSRDVWLARAGEFQEAGADLVLCYPVAALDAFSSVLGTAIACAPNPAVER